MIEVSTRGDLIGDGICMIGLEHDELYAVATLLPDSVITSKRLGTGIGDHEANAGGDDAS